MKHVTFTVQLYTVEYTYSNSEYDRTPILSELFVNRHTLSDQEWFSECEKLNEFKTQEMIVHKNSVINTRLH